MGIFSNKEKKESKKDIATKKASKNTYKIVIKEKFAKGTTTLKTITAQRFIDPDDHVVYLQNESEKFLELMPQDENDYENFDEKSIKNKLNILKQQYKKEQEKDDPNVNDKNILFEIMKLEAKLRAIKFSNSSEYITMDEQGTRTFYFLREGSIFVPFKWDTDTKTVYTASENKKKKAGIARRNKSIKYSKFKNVIEGSVMFMMILVCVTGLGELYLGYQMFSKFDESKIVEAQNFCVQKGAEWTAIVEKNAKASEEIFKQIQDATKTDNPFIDDFIPVGVTNENN